MAPLLADGVERFGNSIIDWIANSSAYHAGSAFLFADIVAMVIRTTIDHPHSLWLGGLGLGVAVIVLAAICERHRELLLSRIRLLSSELATWN